MSKFFYPAQTPNGLTPEINWYQYKSAETWTRGAVMAMDSNGEIVEASADPTAIIGVAASANDQGPGFSMADSPTIVTYRDRKVGIFKANALTTFVGRGVNGGTDPVTPTLTMLDTQFGLTVDSDGIWVIDIAETSTVSVEIVGIITNEGQKLFKFKFLPAVLALP